MAGWLWALQSARTWGRQTHCENLQNQTSPKQPLQGQEGARGWDASHSKGKGELFLEACLSGAPSQVTNPDLTLPPTGSAGHLRERGSGSGLRSPLCLLTHLFPHPQNK